MDPHQRVARPGAYPPDNLAVDRSWTRRGPRARRRLSSQGHHDPIFQVLPPLAVEPAQRCARRTRRRARPYSRGDRLCPDRRGRPQRRALCQLLDRDDHRLYRRTSRDDFGCHRRGRGRRHPVGARLRRVVFVRRDAVDGRVPDYRRAAQARPVDALRLAIGRYRFRQRARDPHFHGATAAADQCDADHLCDGRRRPRYHLPAAAPDHRHPLAADRDRRAVGHFDLYAARRQHRRRHGHATVRAAVLRLARRADDVGDAAHHRAVFADDGGGRPARIAAHRADRRRADRYAAATSSAKSAARASPISSPACSAAWAAAR